MRLIQACYLHKGSAALLCRLNVLSGFFSLRPSLGCMMNYWAIVSGMFVSIALAEDISIAVIARMLASFILLMSGQASFQLPA